MEEYDRIAEELEKDIEKRFSGKSLALHINSVAELAAEIATELHRDDLLMKKRVRVAALAHDLFKKTPQDELRELIQREKVPVDQFSWNTGGGLLHAPTAAHYLSTRYSVNNEDVLCAVYYHTTGRAGASRLEKILFCADYLDPLRELRTSEPDIASLRAKARTDVDSVYREVLGRKLIYTLGKGKPLHPNGIASWNEVSGNNSVQPTEYNL